MFEKVVKTNVEWIDGNGRLHNARYLDTCHLAIRDFFEVVGIGERYRSERGLAFFNLGINLDYYREVLADEPLRITIRIVDSSAKLVHFYIEMLHAETGELKARHERLLVHIDMSTRKSTGFPDDVAARLAEIIAEDTESFDRSLLGRRLDPCRDK